MPAGLRAAEYLMVVAVAMICAVPPPVVFALLFVLALHHYDLTARMEKGAPGTSAKRALLGWDGRVVLLVICACPGRRRPVSCWSRSPSACSSAPGRSRDWREAAMTLLSVVLPVYKVQGYLRAVPGLDAGAVFTDFEIVAVDDCSPDHSGAILAEYAARDPRVRVVTLAGERRPGPGPQRRPRHADGEYVWFVDSDDWLAQGALTAVADRLADTGADVLIVGFDRVHWDGRVTTARARRSWPRRRRRSPSSSSRGSSTCCTSPGTRSSAGNCWSSWASRFEKGWYEDVSFTFPLLAAAERISALPRVCVHYRQRRTGAITRTLGDRHFEIFDHWAHAMALVDQYPERAEALRPVLFRRMIWHYCVVLRNAQRVRKASRRRFFARITEDFHRYRPAGRLPSPAGARGDAAPVRRPADPSSRSGRCERAIAVAGPSIGCGGCRWSRPARCFAGYGKPRTGRTTGLQLRLPVDRKLALYAAYWYRGVTCNPAAIAGKAAELAPDVRDVWVVSRGRGSRAAGHRLRGRGHAGVLPRAGPGPLAGQQRELAELGASSGPAPRTS